MNTNIQAIGFDLFNTLITVEPHTLEKAHTNLAQCLQENGFNISAEPFRQAHYEAASAFLEESRESGRETHNRFWISAALESRGYSVSPDDERIAEAVDAYFSAFFRDCRVIPGTIEMLGTLQDSYRLGLLSNFTHGPAARKIIGHLGLAPFFMTILISGELGYRKPHSFVFERLVKELGADKRHILYVGDDPEPDVEGALAAGLQPVWTTYVEDHDLPAPPRILSRGTGIPDSSVPRISSWDDLIALLEEHHGSTEPSAPS